MSANRDNRIPDAIDKIEPANGAKERMLANIRQKASDQLAAEKSKKPSNKTKILTVKQIMKWALPVAACFTIALIGITVLQRPASIPGEDDPGSIVGIGNPFISVDHAEEFEKKLQITIDAPEGGENVSYSIVDKQIADIIFSFNGHDYDLRASRQSGDFSGLGGIEIKAIQIDAERDATLSTVQDEYGNYKKITWTDGKISYILINTDGAEDDDIRAVFEAIK